MKKEKQIDSAFNYVSTSIHIRDLSDASIRITPTDEGEDLLQIHSYNPSFAIFIPVSVWTELLIKVNQRA
jgi:hypothetical protein